MKKCTVRMIWADGIWYTKANEDAGFGLTLESSSFDNLVERVRIAVPEMFEESFGYTGEIEIIYQVERSDNVKAASA